MISPVDTNIDIFELELFDNGVGADIQSGDGIYSRFVTSYPIIGRYSVKAQVRLHSIHKYKDPQLLLIRIISNY